MTVPRPLAVAHIGITVPDLDAAVAWYGELFGFRALAPPAEFSSDDGGYDAAVVADVLGRECRRFRQAHLATANGVALELFQFVDPPVVEPDEKLPWWRRGIFHLCVVDPDVAGLAQRIVAAGGRQRSRVWRIAEQLPYEFCYCEDPWGTIVELHSHSHEQIYTRHVATP